MLVLLFMYKPYLPLELFYWGIKLWAPRRNKCEKCTIEKEKQP